MDLGLLQAGFAEGCVCTTRILASSRVSLTSPMATSHRPLARAADQGASASARLDVHVAALGEVQQGAGGHRFFGVFQRSSSCSASSRLCSTSAAMPARRARASLMRSVVSSPSRGPEPDALEGAAALGDEAVHLAQPRTA